MQFDLTDRKIISILQKDGRITMKHLGELINMSTPSTIDRVRRLEEAGVIRAMRLWWIILRWAKICIFIYLWR